MNPTDVATPAMRRTQGPGVDARGVDARAGAAAARMPLIGRDRPWGEVRRALATAQKSNRNAQAYSRWVNRPLGRLIAATAYRWGLSPNMISAISACLSFTGILLIATLTPSWTTGVVVGLLLVLGYATDSADGQVARLQGGGSLAGEWLDHVIDAAKNTAFHLAVAIMWIRHLDGWSPLTTLIPLVFTVQASVWFFAVIVTDLLLRGAGVKKAAPPPADEKAPVLTSLLGIPVDYGVLCVVMVLLGAYPVWRIAYTALAVIGCALLVMQLIRWYLRMRAADVAMRSSVT